MFRRAFFFFGSLFLLNILPAWAQRQLVDRVIAVVNDEAITQSELEVFLRPLYEDLKQQYGDKELMIKLNEVRLKLLNQMIEDRLVFQEAKARGITVEESDIDHLVEEARSKFSSDAEFENALSNQGQTLSKLRESYHRELTIRKLHDMEIRSLIVVSPQEIENYYQSHTSELADEESLKVRSLTLRKSDEAVSKGLTDEGAMEKMKSLRKRLVEGEGFEKLAQEFSQDANAKEGGMVGWVKRGSMLPAIDDALFKLKVGGISSVLETSLGYHLFRIEEKKETRVPPLEEVREKIRGIIFQEKARARFKEWMDQLKSRAYITIR